MTAAPASSSLGNLLTEQERNILAMLAAGRSIQEIAIAHRLEHRKTNTIISGICRKLGARNRVQAVAVAARLTYDNGQLISVDRHVLEMLMGVVRGAATGRPGTAARARQLLSYLERRSEGAHS